MKHIRLKLAMSLMVAFNLAACSPTIEPHGDLPLPERLGQIEPGRTKSDVLTLLGTPSTTFDLGVERWYYISNQTKEYMYHPITEVERLVVVIEFDKEGKVSSVRRLGLKDGQDIAMESRTTPTTGQGLSLLGQLIGNVGRFDTGSESNSRY
jgi:outer membrane protein assembly factor BamE (lipoprotein component of BamABCDE complex)